MLRQTDALFGPCDVLIMTAAVSDWRPKVMHPQKLKKDGAGLTVEFEPVPDILATLAQRRRPDQLLVGFAAETGDATGDVLTLGRAKLARKRCDLLVVNDVSGGAVFGSPENEAVILGADGRSVAVPRGSKASVAHAIWDQVVATWS